MPLKNNNILACRKDTTLNVETKNSCMKLHDICDAFERNH